MRLLDISRKLYNGMPVWPGDTPFSFELCSSIGEGETVNIGQVAMSTHIGTHLDAPFHYNPDGEKISELDLSICIGKAFVADLSGRESIRVIDLEKIPLKGIERLLIKTGSWKDEHEFPDKITYIQPELGSYLRKVGIHLIGVDVPSVDPLDSTELLAHHRLGENGIYILESLDLKNVDEGEYDLFAAPLKMEGADGSPVRAVLLDKKGEIS